VDIRFSQYEVCNHSYVVNGLVDGSFFPSSSMEHLDMMVQRLVLKKN
jgi:hypothetical protein